MYLQELLISQLQKVSVDSPFSHILQQHLLEQEDSVMQHSM